MRFKLFLIISCFLGTLVYSQSNNYKFEVGLNGSFIIAGDLQSSYDVLAGANGKYFFKDSEKLHLFVGGGFQSNIGTKGADIFMLNATLGTQYDLFQIKQKPFYLELGIGGLYRNEKFSTQLIDGTIDTTISEGDFMVNFGLGYRFTERINAQLNLTQFGSEGTGLGLGVSYKF